MTANLSPSFCASVGAQPSCAGSNNQHIQQVIAAACAVQSGCNVLSDVAALLHGELNHRGRW